MQRRAMRWMPLRKAIGAPRLRAFIPINALVSERSLLERPPAHRPKWPANPMHVYRLAATHNLYINFDLGHDSRLLPAPIILK